MYFPYLRGKQYELLALRERADAIGHKIVPIIEPVKDPTNSGLEKCLRMLASSDAQAPLVILNPKVGAMAHNGGISSNIAAFVTNEMGTMLRPTILIDESTDMEKISADLDRLNFEEGSLSAIVNGLSADADLDLLQGLNLEFAVLADSKQLRRTVQSVFGQVKRVTLTDPFDKADRNADYLTREVSVFTEENVYFATEGDAGFADYVTIGESFLEGGFSPRSVAIHWTYEREEGGPIMIRHFTSTKRANETADVAGKFIEAATKVVQFLDTQAFNSAAGDVLRTLVTNETYPGLGIAKKLSIQNHLELMRGVLER